MGTVSRLPPPNRALHADTGPRTTVRRQPAIRSGLIPAAAFVCGAAICLKLDMVGEIFVLEPLLFLLSLQCLLARGLGKGFVAPVFIGFVAAGLITLGGYLLSDLVAANEPWQYLKGWGRVVLLVLDSAALMLLAAQARQNIWWFALGMGVGGIGSLLLEGVPLAQWKLGYGEYAALLVVALAPLAPARLATLIVAGFGIACIAADYRSLGAICVIVAAFMLWRRQSGRAFWKVSAAILIGTVVVASLLTFTQEQYGDRRQQSNVGRYVGLLVAWRAISESPLLGYGSWAADKRYTRMLRDEVARLSDDPMRRSDPGRSLLPHSQLLQVWVEGGLPGLAFFLVYAWGLVLALRWFVWQRPADTLTPLFLFLIVGGTWNLLASPILGIMRVYVALTVGVIFVAAFERRRAADAVVGKRVAPEPV